LLLAPLFFAAGLEYLTGVREFRDLARTTVCLIGCWTLFESTIGVLMMSLDAFAIEVTFFISSPNEDPNRRLTAGIVSAVFLAIKLRAGVICALLAKEKR